MEEREGKNEKERTRAENSGIEPVIVKPFNKQYGPFEAFLVRDGSTKPEAPIRDNEYHDSGYQLLLANQVLLIRLCAFP